MKKPSLNKQTALLTAKGVFGFLTDEASEFYQA
jgi:hypothetical protein